MKRLDPVSARAQQTLDSVYALAANAECGPDYSVVAACASCDAFANDCLRALLAQANPFDHPLARRLYRDEVGSDLIPMTWADRMTWFGDITGESLKGRKPWQDFSYLLIVRNGVAHAAGEMTQRDRRGMGVLKVMSEVSSRLSIGFNGMLFSYGPESRKRVVAVAAELIRELDLAAHRTVPGLTI